MISEIIREDLRNKQSSGLLRRRMSGLEELLNMEEDLGNRALQEFLSKGFSDISALSKTFLTVAA